MLWNKETRLYTIPAYSASERNCYGTVTSIRHCYWINNNDLNKNLTVFEVVLGNRTATDFYVTRVLSVYSTPTTDKCSSLIYNWWRLCCDVYRGSGDLFQFAKSQHMIGINLFGMPQGVIRNTYRVPSYIFNGRASVQSSFSLFGITRNESFLLLQFTIGIVCIGGTEINVRCVCVYNSSTICYHDGNIHSNYSVHYNR